VSLVSVQRVRRLDIPYYVPPQLKSHPAMVGFWTATLEGGFLYPKIGMPSLDEYSASAGLPTQ
jgi:hypothetical protein